MSQGTVEIYPNVQSQKKLKLCAVFLGYGYEKQDRAELLLTLEDAIDKYKIDIINAHGFNSDDWLTYKGYDKIMKIPDQDAILRHREYYQRLKKKGVSLIIGAAEPVVPKDLFEKYPEMKNVNNQQFWKFMEDKTKELYDLFPEMDCFEIYLWETPMANDIQEFKEIEFNNYPRFPYYSHSDAFKYMFEAMSKAAIHKNKEFMLLTFSHYPFQEQMIIDALKNRDRNFPFLLDHKSQSGDWMPVKPANNVMQTITDMPAHLQFDGTGEYWGQGLMPYCYPEEIQARVQHALSNNHNINTLSMRVNWANGHIFGKPNEVNFYALSKLAEDPFTPIEQIWKGWAVERFGDKSADKVISALKRTDDIGRTIFFVEGMWIFNHSEFSNLNYLESHAVSYAKATAILKPWDIMGNYKMNELLNYPREQIIHDVLNDKDEALRLNALSLQDIEDAKKTLKHDDYQMLKEQLTRQRDMARASKLHLEAFLRYRIEKLNKLEKGAENREKLEACLLLIEKMAIEMDQKYKEEFPFLKGSLLRNYAKQIRDACKNK
jgi:hypothetical protein